MKFLGHPVHPMLVVFPLGLLCTSVAFDILARATSNSTWAITAYYLIGAGIIGGLLAAIPGAIDWWGIPRDTRARRIGLVHGLGNVVVVLLFAASWLARHSDPAAVGGMSFALSLIGLAVALITGWLGGELVDRLGIGVDPGAHADAPSSLSSEPASAQSGGERRRAA